MRRYSPHNSMQTLSRITRTLFSVLNPMVRALLPPKRHSVHVERRGAEALRDCIRPVTENGHISLLPYRNRAVFHFIRALKYERHRMSISFAASVLRDAVFDEYQEQELLQEMHHLICAVPPTDVRMRQNGYDHLRAVMSKLTGEASLFPLSEEYDLLRWRHPVRRQSTLKNRKERVGNVHRALETARAIPAHTVCFVFDDMTTTGATLDEARRALKKGGAAEVITLALARPDDY